MPSDLEIQIAFEVSTDEAADFASLLPRLTPSALDRFAWRGFGDDENTVARWAIVFDKLAAAFAAKGYPATRRIGPEDET